MKRKWITGLLAFMMAVMTATGCSLRNETTESNVTENEEKNYVYRVGFVNIDNGDTNCYPAMQNFQKIVESAEFAEAVGAEKVETMTADSALSVDKQSNNVETMLTKGVDMMFIIGVDTAANAAAVQTCNSEGVPVFMVGTEATSGEWKFIGFDESEIGQHQGAWCVENLPENANICYIQGTPGREAAVLREQGFMDAIAERDDLNVLSSQPGNFTTEDSMRVTEDWIQKYGDDIDCIVAPDNFSILGVCEALKAANMTEVITCGVVGNREDAYLINEGSEDYAVFVYWPMIGDLCAEIAQKEYLGEEINERTNIELFDMTADNCNELLDKYIPQ
ncbi:MAG: sugar ABC transporter substrate-binding protein [Ruminococcus sp.]|jgi:ABC-type sugar transport system substrate-binding protein